MWFPVPRHTSFAEIKPPQSHLTAHGLGEGLIVAAHCWGAAAQKFAGMPTPGWPDNDPHPWDDGAGMSSGAGGGNTGGRRGRVIWMTNGMSIPQTSQLHIVIHHVW